MEGDIHRIALVKGTERYMIRFGDAQCADALHQLGLWAMDPRLSLSWSEAAEMQQMIKDGLEFYMGEGRFSDYYY